MAEIYFIRHGIAGERTDFANDAERPLTETGCQKTRKVAQRLQQIGVQFDLILTSPLVRARQTAEILQEAKLSQEIVEFSPLAPAGNLQDWVNWWSDSRYNRSESRLALVGHQPNLGNWAEILVWGTSQDKLVLKKAGVIGIMLPETTAPMGRGELFLLVPPKFLLSANC
jgi:phosphohistidine phosphatase